MKKIISLFLIYNSFAWGVESFSHPTCKYSFIDNQLNAKETTYLKTKLQERGYIFDRQLITKDNPKFQSETLYIETGRILSGKLYKECLVELNIKQASGQYISKKDESVYKRSSLRKFPRQTFKGNERCFMALTDLTFSINYCKTGTKK